MLVPKRNNLSPYLSNKSRQASVSPERICDNFRILHRNLQNRFLTLSFQTQREDCAREERLRKDSFLTQMYKVHSHPPFTHKYENALQGHIEPFLP